jgi:signal transduction histidine kinase
VQSVYLLDRRGVVAASPRQEAVGTYIDQRSPVCQSCHLYPAPARPRSVVVNAPDGEPVFRTMTPILNRPACYGCHAPEQRLNGVLYVDFSMAGMNARVRESLVAALLASLAIIVLCAAAIYALLSWLVMTPLERVAQALGRFGSGQREVRAAVHSRDELGLLAGGFNTMAGTIQAQETVAGRLYSELEAKDELRRQLLSRLTNAREEERRYFARELHDRLGQLLTGLSLHLKLGQQALAEPEQHAAQHLARAHALVGETIDESHRLIVDLRPIVLDECGLIPALEDELQRRLSPLGIVREVDADGNTERLPPEVATAAFRIAQEAITNIIRHAQAQRVNVLVRRTAGALCMAIEDDGVGLPPDDASSGAGGRQAFGILGMQERAAALCGTVEVSTRQPQGTAVRLWLPLEGDRE